MLVAMLKLPVEIVPCPIVREPDGLAMSSRNKLLTPEERKLAPKISQILFETRKKVKSFSVPETVRWGKEEILKIPEMNLEYFEIADAETLQPVSEIKKPCVVCIAVKLGRVRLIDNVRL
jgi:pantoate--beta-alanine ligase